MGNLNAYRDIIERALSDYAALISDEQEPHLATVFDRNHDQYLLVKVGWRNRQRLHSCLLHLEIINGKIWIQEDHTEHGIATDLEVAGIPKHDIVLGFHPPDVRPYTEYATA